MTRSQAVKENNQQSITGTPAGLYSHKYNLTKGVSWQFADNAELLK